MLPILETPRLRLRALIDGDIPALFEIYKDPEAMRYWSHPAMTDIGEAEALLKDIASHEAPETLFEWGISRREDELVIGTCTLHRIEKQHRRAELGYILRRDVWGRGFAHEALTALVNHAFGAMGLHRLEADIDPRNAASIRSVERLRFRQEGRLRERYFLAGEIQDSLIYGLLAAEWISR